MILTILISSLLEASMLSDNSSPCYPGCRTRGSSPCRWTRSISIPAINDRLFFVSLFLHLVFMSLFGLIVQTCYEIKFEFQDDFISRFYPSQLGSNIGSRICSRIASPLASMTASPVLPSSPILSRRAVRSVSHPVSPNFYMEIINMNNLT